MISVAVPSQFLGWDFKDFQSNTNCLLLQSYKDSKFQSYRNLRVLYDSDLLEVPYFPPHPPLRLHLPHSALNCSMGDD